MPEFFFSIKLKLYFKKALLLLCFPVNSMKMLFLEHLRATDSDKETVFTLLTVQFTQYVFFLSISLLLKY